MQKIIDITGNKYNMLTVLRYVHSEKIRNKHRTFWECQCDCGNIVILRKDEFIYPYSKTKSCGCWHRKESSQRPKDNKTGKFIKIKKEVNNE